MNESRVQAAHPGGGMKGLHSSESINSVCLCPTVNPVFWQRGVSEHLSGDDSSVWSPDLSGSSAISVWTRILNMHSETPWEEKVTWVPEGGEKSWLWWYHWFATIPAFHPWQMNYINLTNRCMCDIVRIRLQCLTYTKWLLLVVFQTSAALQLTPPPHWICSERSCWVWKIFVFRISLMLHFLKFPRLLDSRRVPCHCWQTAGFPQSTLRSNRTTISSLNSVTQLQVVK